MGDAGAEGSEASGWDARGVARNAVEGAGVRQLPVLNAAQPDRSSPARRSPIRSAGVLAVRLSLLVVALAGLHQASQRGILRAQLAQREPPSLAAVQQLAPTAARLEAVQFGAAQLTSELQSAAIGYRVFNSSGESLGIAITTSPEADSIVGYSGANNVLLLLDDRQRILGAGLLRSGDTAEHAAQVVEDPQFWSQFDGLAMGESTELDIDGVSGATLTSLAIAEGIQLRMSGRKLSLRFPDPIALAEVQQLLPEATKIGEEVSGLLRLEGAGGEHLGWVARTGEVVDAEEGYQGPTELLLLFDVAGVLKQVRIRKSFDNEPYVGYVKQEYSFWARFKGRNLSELAALDVEKEEIEGVSGATMTSLAVARTIGEAVRRLQVERAAQVPKRQWNWSISELATACVAGASLLWSRSKWRGRKWPRLIWQAVCVVVIGGWTGNLISLALLAGWTGAGVSYRLAPGLSVLLVVAVLWPVFSKQNVYCDHVCPHGVLQQWLGRWRRSSEVGVLRARRGYGTLQRILSVTPWVALLAAAGWLLFQWPVELAWLEPFDAYSWRIGWSLSGLVWLSSLLLAVRRPMLYCRLLCPTGKALDYVRRGKRMRFSWVDVGVLAVAALAWWQASQR